MRVCKWCNKELTKNKKSFCCRSCQTSYRNHNKVWTEEERQHLSEIKTGSQNGMYGKRHTEETKLKISESRSGILHTDATKKLMSESQKERWCEWRLDNPDKIRYRELAFDNYEHVCYNCGRAHDLEVHHLDGDRTNNDVKNLVILCSSCHHKYAHTIVHENGKIVAVKLNKEFSCNVIESRRR